MTTPQVGTQTLNDQNRPLTVGDWVITLIILSIPVVNLIFLLYWALSSNSNVNRKNLCIAYLILLAIFIGIAIVFGVLALVLGLFAEHADSLHGVVYGLSSFYG